MIEPRPRTVLFDFDLTLVDSSQGFLACHAFASRALGLPEPPLERILPTIGTPLPVVFERLHGAANLHLRDEYLRIYHARADEVMAGLTVYLPGAVDTLHLLKAGGLKLGIVSQKLRYRVEDVLRRAGLLTVLDAIIGGDDAPALKPDPAGLLMAAARLSTTHGDTLYVGDTTVDAEAAHNAEMRFAGVLTGVTPREAFTPYQPLLVLASVVELPAHLGVS